VLVVAEKKILLVQGWLDDGKWGLVGGGLHHKEPPLTGAVREVAEETGIKLKSKHCQYLGSEWRGRSGLRFYCHFFVAELTEIKEINRQKHEIIAARWASPRELKALPLKAEVRRALQLYRQL
jgi:8-oxo-dGTP pyrophosphatase MutT (NUDIX family)